MKVSVIVTVYNLENYIEETLKSVFNQTYKNLEIIVVDDCSIDNSEEIIGRYKDQVKYIRTEKNGGVLLATCEGLKVATGDIITFLDGDDIWHLNKVEEIVKIYQQDKKYVLLSHDYEYINENSKLIYSEDNTQTILQNLSVSNDVESINLVMREGIKIPQGRVWLGSAFSINTKNFHVKDFLDWVDTLHKPSLVYQDWPLATFIMASNDGKFGYINKKLFQYRLHESNYSGGSKMTRQRAIKVAQKGLYTSLSIENILQNFKKNFEKKEYERVFRNRQLMTHEYEFIIAVYNRDIFNAYKLYKNLKENYWTREDVKKNLLRMIIFTLFDSLFFDMKYFFNKIKRYQF